MKPILVAAVFAILTAVSPVYGETPPLAQPSQPTSSAVEALETGISTYGEQRLAAIQAHLGDLIAALPALPADAQRVWEAYRTELEQQSKWRVLFLLAALIALGFGSEYVVRRATRRRSARILELPLHTVRGRLRATGLRLAMDLAGVVAFVIGSVVAFLAFNWPPLLRQTLLGYALAFVALRLTMVVARCLLAPDMERFRLLPMTDPAARFWHGRIALAVGWFAFGWVTVTLPPMLAMPDPHRKLFAYALGLGLLAIGVATAFQRPAEGGRRSPAWLLTGYFVVLWALWVASAMPLFWLLAVGLALPLAVGIAQRSVGHVLRPASGEDVPVLVALCAERGGRALLVIGAALFLAHKWNIDLTTMLSADDTAATRLVRGAVSAVIIVLVADFAWSIIKAVIDQRLADKLADDAEAGKQARLRTLLPILKHVARVFIIVLALMMVLSQLGVSIGPLIASAGVIGVAIGFGSQTLVRDIISGMFYLLDDAFRVGEYIQSANYKGTVESFSLRSVKLRHHRGPLYTVPFGVLGAIQNMSRDWVIDKLTVGVEYNTDLDKVKKLVKQIGKELAEDPEFAPHIIEPLKMQGVEAFGDYAIQLRMKMMTKPNEQFVIRRKAYAMLKQRFEANGIHFAFPTVQVAGGAGGEASAEAAVARQALEAAKASKLEVVT